MTQLITRELILQTLRAAVEPLAYVQAMWEGGAAAFGRVDAWSDIDLQLDVDDEHSAAAAEAAEQALAGLAPLALKYVLPQPAWHGHWQSFYRLAGASEFLLVDLVVIRHSNPRKFLEADIHGPAVVHFDKTGVVAAAAPLDKAALLGQLQGRAAELRTTLELFRPFMAKELHRGNAIEAFSFYQALTLRPLVEALRLRHCPARYNFHTRYVYYDLPSEVARRLEPFFFIADTRALAARHAEALAWCTATLDEVTPAALARGLGVS